MSTIRAAAVAGTFYPADTDTLNNWLDEQLPQASVEYKAPRMLLLPHAGYGYSGKLAALGVSQLSSHPYRRVIILAPAHKIYLEGVALPDETCQSFATPLGVVPLDREGITALQKQEGVCQSAPAHELEHAIEVQLPLLQRQLTHFELLPLVVGKCQPRELTKLLAPLLDNETLLIISSDLSHELSWQEAREQDTFTLTQILTLDRRHPLTGEQACGHYSINAALHLASDHKWRPRLLGHYNSGDVTGYKLRVVGYAALAFYP
ncbi:MAG: AmmeMemoRadiSam system protein B [Aeromonadaceae bacterium]